ncbi:hypothetical protein RB601_000590 [Gaeumannomyces tritici]
MRVSVALVPTLLGLAAGLEPTSFTTPSLDGSFTIPPGTPDGVYAVHTANGTARHVLLDASRPGTLTSALDGSALAVAAPVTPPQSPSPSPPPPPPPGRLAKRQWRSTWRVFCPAGRDGNNPPRMDAGQTDAAVDDVRRQCGGRLDVPSGWHIYAVRGSVAAFYCNFISDSTYCSSTEFRDRADEITTTCGAYVAGWNDQVAQYGNPVTSEYHVGSYGYHNVDGNKNFCGRNHHSPRRAE